MLLLLSNARVIDPANNVDEIRDVAIDDDRLVNPRSVATDPADETVDLAGKVLCPGLLDMHVHFREPGYEYKEDTESGTQAAAAGGFTTVVAMPNTDPALDSVDVIHELQERITSTARVRTRLTACLTKGRLGVELTDFNRLAAETAIVALTDDGDCIADFDLMLAAANQARAVDLPITDHCQDYAVDGGGVMRLGEVSKMLDVPGMPGAAESNMVARNVELARRTGGRFHIQHISCEASIDCLRQAQAEGLPVTAEVTPHHLCLTHDIVPIMGANAKMNPPLGTEADRRALLAALADGIISVIGTDHAPHAPAEKARGLVEAPFGILGLETAFPLSMTEVYHSGILTLAELITRFTTGPAAVLNLDAGTLSDGAAADVTIFDPDAEYAIDITASVSKSRNSPFHNRRVKGKILGTICGGKWAYRDATIK